MSVRRLLAQENSEDNQLLKVDHASRYIFNDTDDWQMLFGPSSDLTHPDRKLKLAAELNTDTMDSIRMAAYLYNASNGSINSLSSCVFNVYVVQAPNWIETFVGSFSGTLQSNGYYFTDVSMASLMPANLDGDSTLMIEVVATRLLSTIRDRVYDNHLGVYDSIFRLKRRVTLVELTKLDE